MRGLTPFTSLAPVSILMGILWIFSAAANISCGKKNVEGAENSTKTERFRAAPRNRKDRKVGGTYVGEIVSLSKRNDLSADAWKDSLGKLGSRHPKRTVGMIAEAINNSDESQWKSIISLSARAFGGEADFWSNLLPEIKDRDASKYIVDYLKSWEAANDEDKNNALRVIYDKIEEGPDRVVIATLMASIEFRNRGVAASIELCETFANLDERKSSIEAVARRLSTGWQNIDSAELQESANAIRSYSVGNFDKRFSDRITIMLTPQSPWLKFNERKNNYESVNPRQYQ